MDNNRVGADYKKLLNKNEDDVKIITKVEEAPKEERPFPWLAILATITFVAIVIFFKSEDEDGTAISEIEHEIKLSQNYPGKVPLMKATNRFVSADNKSVSSVLPGLNKVFKKTPFSPQNFVVVGKTAIYTPPKPD